MWQFIPNLFIQSLDKVIPVFAVYNNGQEYYAIVACYVSTVHKVMGQTLSHVTLVFDMRILSQGIGYVALSRVSSLDNVVPLLRLRRSHFINIDRLYNCTYSQVIFKFIALKVFQLRCYIWSVWPILTCQYVTVVIFYDPATVVIDMYLQVASLLLITKPFQGHIYEYIWSMYSTITYKYINCILYLQLY